MEVGYRFPFVPPPIRTLDNTFSLSHPGHLIPHAVPQSIRDMQQQRQIPFVPPTAVGIPLAAVQSLVPQLATAINDIDTLKAQLSAGNANATFPSW